MKAISVIALALGCVISASATAGTLKPLEASNVQTQLADLINLYAGLEDQQQQNQILHESILRKSFGQVARSLLAGADPNSVIEGGSPVQKLLHSWDREIFDKWPLDNTDGHKRTFNILRDLEADFLTNCPVAQAARLRNAYALDNIINSDQITREHVETCLLENFERYGFNVLHFSASSPAPGIARLFFRGGKNGVKEGDEASARLQEEMGITYRDAMWPVGMKNDHEASAPPLELEVLLPYLLPEGRRLRYGQLTQRDDPALDALYEIDTDSAKLLPLLQHIDGSTGTNPLVRACMNGRAETVQTIIDIFPAPVARYAAHAGFSYPNSHGMGCAHMAARAGYQKILRILHDSLGRDTLLARDAFGRTPCDIALSFGRLHKSVLEYLVSVDACLPPVDYEYDNPMEEPKNAKTQVPEEKKELLPKPVTKSNDQGNKDFNFESIGDPENLQNQQFDFRGKPIDNNNAEATSNERMAGNRGANNLAPVTPIEQMNARFQQEKRWREEVVRRMNRCPIPTHLEEAARTAGEKIDIGALRSSQLPELPGFNPYLHVLAGWRLLSPEALASMGLPSNLLERDATNRGNLVNLSENFKEACTVDELPLTALRRVHADGGLFGELLGPGSPLLSDGYDEDDPESNEGMHGKHRNLYSHYDDENGDSHPHGENDGEHERPFHETVFDEGHFYDYDGEIFLEPPMELIRDHFSLTKPFIVRGAYDVTTMESLFDDSGDLYGEDDGYAEFMREKGQPRNTGYKSYARMLHEFGQLWVEAGALPYATAYGGKTNSIYAGEFIQNYMGNTLKDNLQTPHDMINLLRNIEDPDYLGNRPVTTTKGEDFSYTSPREKSQPTKRFYPDEDVRRELGGRRQRRYRNRDPNAHHNNEGSVETREHPSIRLAKHILQSGEAYTGPGDEIKPMPYIFDGSIIDSGPGVPVVSNFSFPKVFNKDDSHRQFALGSSLTGAMPHFHGAAVNAVFFGVKLWVLVPPEYASFTDSPASEWWQEFYLPAHAKVGWKGHKDAKPFPHYLALQGPGDLVYVPHHYGHAVLNLADTFAFAYE